MKTHRGYRFLTLLATLSLLAVACGSSADVSTESTESDGPETETVDDEVSLVGRFSEQDLDQARLAFDAAKAHWEGLEPFAYTFSAGVDTISLIEIEFDVDGNASPETVVFGEADPEGWATVPRSVEQAFDEIEVTIAAFESGEFEVPGSDDCGHHFNVEFDPEYGAPHYYDGLGPCDDGVGIRMSVVAEGDEADGPVPPSEPCNADEYIGTWLSPRAAGTEPLEPDDGVNDEGGAGVVVLNLDHGESTLQEADSIEVIGEWFCTDSTLIRITNDGEEIVLATINDDDTLTVRDWTLVRG